MCGRYAQFTPPEAIAEIFGATLDIADVGPRYNAAPMQWLPAIREGPSGERVASNRAFGIDATKPRPERNA